VYIAERLGITYQGYLKKENGENEFMASEIKTMQELLGLSAKDIREIFLS
jgi:hypothetical protein